MKRRIHLFEFEDFDWLPEILRNSITDLLHLYHRILQTEKIWAPKMNELINKTQATEFIDVCSGSGGPIPDVIKHLEENYDKTLSATMTDLYPNKEAAALINSKQKGKNLTYLTESINATDIPKELSGIRTMFCSFHHMPVDLGQGIINDAFEKKQAIAIFEITENSLGGIFMFTGIPLFVGLSLPFLKPSWWQILLTYSIPLIPLLATWDGIVSHLRTYSPEEFTEMTRHLKADDYQWEIGTLTHWLLPHKMPYLMGWPTK